jgi:ketosteroid isomerase-like protein
MNRSPVVAVLLVLGVLGAIGWAPARAATTESASVSAVWALEDAYWRYVKAGDVENYVTLWHPDFIGWPCDQPHPMRKASIGDWVRKVRDEKIVAAISLTHEGAQAFDDIVVVHYSFTNVSTFPDGRVEGAGVRRKITHTWMRAGDTWQIVGGMCGPLEETSP